MKIFSFFFNIFNQIFWDIGGGSRPMPLCFWVIPCQIIQAIAPPISDSLKIWTEGTTYQSIMRCETVFSIIPPVLILQACKIFRTWTLKFLSDHKIWILSKPWLQLIKQSIQLTKMIEYLPSEHNKVLFLASEN